MSTVKMKYLKDEDGNVFSPVASSETVFYNKIPIMQYFKPTSLYLGSPGQTTITPSGTLEAYEWFLVQLKRHGNATSGVLGSGWFTPSDLINTGNNENSCGTTVGNYACWLYCPNNSRTTLHLEILTGGAQIYGFKSITPN